MGAVLPISTVETSEGSWTPMPEGGWLWAIGLRSSGANAIRLRVQGLEAVEGAELVVYDSERPDDCLGPVVASLRTAEGLWTPSVGGDEVLVEVFVPDSEHPRPGQHSWTIDAILYEYRGSWGAGGSGGIDEMGCHLDVSCYPQWELHANGVGRMTYIANGLGWNCSGAMLNRVSVDFTPLFMTANHCQVGPANGGTVQVFWFFETDMCNGIIPPLGSVPRTMGATPLVSDPDTDYRLLGLLGEIPGGLTYLGWDSAYWSLGSDGIGIHHPDGAHKRISFGVKLANHTNCVNAQAWRVRFSEGDGRLEGGSSGSPILDTAGRVRGVASCGPEFPDCEGDELVSFGRFDRAYDRLHPFLNPTDPIYVRTFAAGPQLGTYENPFNSLAEGVFAVKAGSTIHFYPGDYSAEMTISKPLTLRTLGGTVTLGG